MRPCILLAAASALIEQSQANLAQAKKRLEDLMPVAPEDALVIHGENDEVVPLSEVMDWARPQSLPVTVVPGGGHFFHGQLPLLRSLVARHLRA